MKRINENFRVLGSNEVMCVTVQEIVQAILYSTHFKLALAKAWFKRRILHAPNRIAKLNACKMRRLNQLNAACFNSMRVSRIFD